MSQAHHHDQSTQGRGRQRISKKNLFIKDLPSMMFGFGDPDPQREVIALMEEMVIDHISDVLISAHKVSTNRGKLKVDDIKFALQSSSTRVHNPTTGPSNHPEIIYASYPLARRKATLEEKQLSRIEELLFMQEDLARARGRADDLKAYGEDEPNDPGGPEPIEPDSNYSTDKGKQRDYRI
ncbi:uncharacterized protein MELLADRAFT_106084 [Melampsora larici-populina 98AG31]|uniref:Transcription initiation factor TFIID subunit 13 n=1 Tax=Melampsora larici-populina (strain 98AG31 / pathotype 3-4-7) TaxID=747676 RepID=F4RKB9_MELLP|nr:uncharacterized protein MELLADRAFT_106084 [Melampsora larici-populina 98AG31]EGG07066.1 hypothetical protein MELLADRAFT_106084 [Melampsora larici-populina 98AG31]